MVLLKLYVMGQVYRMQESLEMILGLNRQWEKWGRSWKREKNREYHKDNSFYHL